MKNYDFFLVSWYKTKQQQSQNYLKYSWKVPPVSNLDYELLTNTQYYRT